PIEGSATLATDRFRLATAATRMSEMRTSPSRFGAAEGGASVRSSSVGRCSVEPFELPVYVEAECEPELKGLRGNAVGADSDHRFGGGFGRRAYAGPRVPPYVHLRL